MKQKKKMRSARPHRPAKGARGRAKPRRKPGKLFEALVAVQARLRAPKGCPWDLEQTHDTLRPYLLEEAYEVLDALDSGDANHIAEELGDVLLQVVFHAQLAAEAGRFDISDVVEHIHTKMVRRHPHVFGNAKADTAAQVLKKWEELKAEERAGIARRTAGGKSKSARATGDGKPASILDAVPRTLPALLEGYQLSRRAANVGFDWRRTVDILDKLTEETAEMRRVLESESTDRARKEDELGDLLFVCVNLARVLGLDAEIALKKANLKFSRRFRHMEQTAAARNQQLSKLSSDELESLWTEAKQAESR